MSVAAPSSRRLPQSAPRALARRPGVAMLVWGCLVAALAASVLLTITPRVWPMEDWRGVKLRESMALLAHGGPLLLGSHGPHGGYYAIDLGDDEGLFVYVPLLSRLLGVGDPLSTVRYLYVVLLSFGALVYPSIFLRLTRSWLAALASPLMYLVCIMSLGFVDVYWIPAWGALMLLPLIFLLARDWPRLGFLALAAIALAASWMTSIRSYSGLGIFVAAALVLVLRRWRWRRLLPALALLAGIYISINAFAFSAVRAERDHWLGATAKKIDVSSSHALWGEAYEGLGYLPNGYGMRFLDGVPNARVQREAPGTLDLSGRYEAVIREAFFAFAAEHPAEVARQYAAKVVVVLADLAPYLLIVVLTLPAMLLVGPETRVVRRWAMLALPATLVELAPPLLTLPRQSYEEGAYGVTGAVGILGLCWTIRRIELAVRRHGGWRAALAPAAPSWGRLVRDRGPGWRSARLSLLAAAALIALAVGAYPLRRQANRWQHQPSGVLMEHLTAVRRLSPTAVSLTGSSVAGRRVG
jgi:hypothetical protein